MTTIYIDPFGTTTSLATAYSVGATVDSVDNDELTTTLACTTITSALTPAYANCDMANKYIDSLTDEQLVYMEQQLAEKDQTHSIKIGDTEIGVDLPKVYVKKGTK